MAHTVRHLSELTLNTDGRSHPKENALAVATLVFGLAALATAYWHGLHLFTAWTGLVGLLTGAWSQMVSATTGERFVTVIGLGAAGVGFFLAMAHGGLFGGVVG